MPEIVEVPLADLLLDPANARLGEGVTSQTDTALALARQQGGNIIRLAQDIVVNGVDPTNFPAIVATDDQKKRYRVREGNRRILALKALETPALISSVLSKSAQKQLLSLSDQYADEPYELVLCVLFGPDDREQELLDHWIELRHTGQNQGIGLVEWGSDEKDRFASRHGKRLPAGQVLDFVFKHGTLTEETRDSSRKIITSVTRLLSSPAVRKVLGIDVVKGEVISLYPREEVARSLSRMVEDLASGALSVKDIYHAPDRTKYAKSFPKGAVPRKTKKLKAPVNLDTLGAGKASAKTLPAKSTRRRRQADKVRTSLIPRDCQLDVDPPRINAIYSELLQLTLDTYPNAGSVLFRVFVEVSVDHYLEMNELMSDDERANQSLAKRIKTVAKNLHKEGKINTQLHAAIQKIADSKQVLAASTVTWNQYVHNKYVFPKSSELRAAWDEIQPFMEQVWAS